MRLRKPPISECQRAYIKLITISQPFQDKFPINPSFEITQTLPEYLPPTPAQRHAIRIVPYGQPVRVAYEDVREIVPLLHQSYVGTMDLVLHIGMASGRKYYAIERYGNRDGYDKNPDVDGKKLSSDDGVTHFGDCPSRMTTSLDFDDTWRRWQSKVIDKPLVSPILDGVDLRPSEDAGHYLCDYIYFSSLAWFGRRSKSMEGGTSKDRPVLFFHVPAESDEETLEKGRIVATCLIRAMVESWISSGGR